LLHAVGLTEEAEATLRRSVELWPSSAMPKYMHCFALVAAGKLDEARTLARTVETSEPVKAYFVAMCYVALGETDKAFEWFEKAVGDRNEWLVWFGTEPLLDPIRTDPRYSEILRKINNPLAAGGDSGEFRFDTDERVRSIAILPFKILGSGEGESGDHFLSIGLADAVTMRLSNIGRFLVRPTSSVVVYSKGDVDAFVAGRELGVKFIVDGIIRHIEDKIRVTVQLLDIEENSTIWAASFDEAFTDVLELEDLISERVTHSLLPKISGEEERRLAKRGTDNPAAYEAYLQGRYFWNQFTPSALEKAIEHYRTAIELDPNYALAWAGIADFYSWASIYGMVPPSKSFDKVYRAASKAIALDESLAEAHSAFGLYYSNSQDWEKSEAEHRRAIELNPNYPLAHEWLSALLVGTGRFDEGRCEILVADQLDPLSLRPKVLTAWTIYQTRDYATSLDRANEIITLDPDFWQGYLQAANILLEMGDVARSLEYARRAADLGGSSPLPTYMLCYTLNAAGENEEALAIADGILEQSRSTYISPYFIGMSLLGAGDLDRAFVEFEKAQAEKSAWLVWWGTEPKLDRAKSDERYWKILRETKNPIINLTINGTEQQWTCRG
jgi:TolB-like protein/Tfp pilus assembly protein PilF